MNKKLHSSKTLCGDVVRRACTRNGPKALALLASIVLPLLAASAAAGAPIVSLTLLARTGVGEPVDLLHVGDTIVIDVRVNDARTQPLGIYSAYADLRFDAALARVDGPVSVAPFFPLGHTDAVVSSGLLDEFGGLVDFQGPPVVESTLFSIPFTVTSPGKLSFVLDSADLVHHEVLVSGRDTRLRANEIGYGSLTVDVVPEPNTFLLLLCGVVAMSRRMRLCFRS